MIVKHIETHQYHRFLRIFHGCSKRIVILGDNYIGHNILGTSFICIYIDEYIIDIYIYNNPMIIVSLPSC